MVANARGPKTDRRVGQEPSSNYFLNSISDGRVSKPLKHMTGSVKTHLNAKIVLTTEAAVYTDSSNESGENDSVDGIAVGKFVE